MRRDFVERKREIRRYLKFVSNLDTKKIRLADRGLLGDAYEHSEEHELLKTLKANLFLLLYNLVEATVKNAIEAIFERLSRESVSFDICRSELKQVVLRNLKGHSVDQIHVSMTSIAIDVVTKTFRKEQLFSGNVDAREIRETAKKYGFNHPTVNGSELLTVKSNRNDLAHGDKTFSAVGADYDVPRLKKIAMQVFKYLGEFIKNIESYLTSKSYLATP
jgi:MAE_28990/MAE_18760-like HEPN